MATNVNLLDRSPQLVIQGLNWVLAPAEDQAGLERPLWVDISANQGAVSMTALAANGVLGVMMRAGISWGYQDKWFPTYWADAGSYGLYRTSYHVIYTDEPVIKQADNWYRVHDRYDGIPRIIDFEVDQLDAPQKKAEAAWAMSELILSRDGFRPLIYSRYKLVDDWLASWSPSMLNAHYWILAQYLWDRTREHPGPPTLPARLDRSRVVMHQTCDKKTAFSGACDSYALDRDRWCLGPVESMHEFIRREWAGGGLVRSDWFVDIDRWAHGLGFVTEYGPPDPGIFSRN